MEIPSKIQDEIWDYCRANKITNIDEFTVNLIKQGFTVEKFGATPNVIEKVVEVEKIIEVEKIVEVEKIIEVEKVVEKKIMVSDSKGNKKLTDEIARLTQLDKDNNEKLKAETEKNGFLDAKIKELEKELTEEKNKKKRDIYGE